ncbi:hypothetical protein KP509_1Z306000 [Ceratopteris richardii]|nr:hypothetical protein KP509_1Z306000 [Ceratopteris richardii]
MLSSVRSLFTFMYHEQALLAYSLHSIVKLMNDIMMICGGSLQFSTEQATQDPETYFNLRLNSCPAAELTDGSRVIYVEQAFLRTPDKPYRQRFLKIKSCPKDIKCDAEVSSYAIRDPEEYRNFCDRLQNQRPQPEEVARDIAEHLTTLTMSRCGKDEQCFYKGSTTPGGFPNYWNGATTCTSDLVILKDGGRSNVGTEAMMSMEYRFGV